MKRKKSKSSSPYKKTAKSNRKLFFLFCLVFLLVPVCAYLMIIRDNKSASAAFFYSTNARISWKAPFGRAQFIDSGRKIAYCPTGTQTASVTECSTDPYTYWPGSSLIYSVKSVLPSPPAITANLPSNGTTATPDGRGYAKWNWDYELKYFPSKFASCVAAGVECKSISAKAREAWNTQVEISNLTINTKYRADICLKDCPTGNKYTSAQFETLGMSCHTGDVNGDGRVNSLDQLLIAKNYSPPAVLNKNYDVNKDDKVDSADLQEAAKHFNEPPGCG